MKKHQSEAQILGALKRQEAGTTTGARPDALLAGPSFMRVFRSLKPRENHGASARPTAGDPPPRQKNPCP